MRFRNVALFALVLLAVNIDIGAFPRSAAEGQVLVVGHKQGDSVGFYNAETGQLLTTVPVGVKPHEMALSADGRFIYVTNYGVDSYTSTAPGGNTISVIDAARREKLADIDLGKFHRPHGIQRARSGRLYVTIDLPPSLLVIDPAKRTILRDYPLNQSAPHMLAVSADERKAYVANSSSGSVSAIPLAGPTAIKNISVGGVPMGLALNPAGDRLFATTRTANNIAVIDTRTDEIVHQMGVPGQPVRLRFTPDGKKLLVSTIEAGEVVVIDAAAFRVIHRFPAGRQSEGILVDPAGRFGFVSAQGDNRVTKFSLGDWKPLLEIKTGPRPDPLLLLDK